VLSVAKPTDVLSGPTDCTSINLSATVHNTNARIKLIEIINAFLNFFILLYRPFFIMAFARIYFTASKKKTQETRRYTDDTFRVNAIL
jgi:hypothetical protein